MSFTDNLCQLNLCHTHRVAGGSSVALPQFRSHGAGAALPQFVSAGSVVGCEIEGVADGCDRVGRTAATAAVDVLDPHCA